MLLLKCSPVAGDAKSVEVWTRLKCVGAKLSLLLDLKFVGVLFHLMMIVHANAFQDHSLETSIVNFLIRYWLLLFYTLQKEVHAVLKRYGVTWVLVEAQRLQSFVLSIVVINVLQVVLIDQVTLNQVVQLNVVLVYIFSQ